MHNVPKAISSLIGDKGCIDLQRHIDEGDTLALHVVLCYPATDADGVTYRIVSVAPPFPKKDPNEDKAFSKVVKHATRLNKLRVMGQRHRAIGALVLEYATTRPNYILGPLFCFLKVYSSDIPTFDIILVNVTQDDCAITTYSF